MGQRQQSWIIAKVNGSYRVLAVVHNQWAYGTIPIKACWRLFRILENPENKRLARHELTATAAKDADWWKKQQEMAYSERDVVDAIPFQFLLTCLVLATSFDPRVDRTVSYGSRVHPLDVNTSWSQVDNNDGFTILDITDIDKPSYCFTQINRWGEHDDAAEGRVSCGTPMTDLEYLSYYPDLGNLYHPSLAAWDVINAGVLWDLWPDGDWSDRSDAGDPKDVQRTVSASEQDNVNLSLSELAFKKAVEAALDDETAEEALSSVEHIPSLPGRLARYMLGNPALVKRPCGPQLLARSLKGELAGSNGNLLDLSHWPLLGEDDILYVVKHSTLTNEVAGVDLSNNGNVSAQCVKALVHLCPRLTKIVAFNTPALSMSDLLGCMDPSRTHDIFHSDHFRAAFAADFTRGDSQSSDVNRVTTPDISAPNTLTQIFYYCDHPFYLPRDEAAQGSGDKPDSGLHWKGAVDKLEEKGSILDVRGYNQPIVRAIPLQDVILAPDSIVDWFPQVIQLALHHRNSQERLDAASICPDSSMALAVGLKVCRILRDPSPFAIPYMENPTDATSHL